MTKGNYPCAKDQKVVLEISDLNHRGEGVGRVDGFALFVPGVLPGEKVRVRVTAIHKSYGEAELIDLIKASPNRSAPLCPYFGRCGGCQLQHLSYEKQLAWKEKMLKETLRRIAGIKVVTLPLAGMNNPWEYRNKARLHFALDNNYLKTGFYTQRSNHIIHIETCPVQHPSNNAAFRSLHRTLLSAYCEINSAFHGKAMPAGALIRSSLASSETLITLEASPARQNIELYEMLAARINAESVKKPAGIALLQRKGSSHSIQALSGSLELTEEIGPFRYLISPQSFFQVNPRQAQTLYEIAAAMAGRPALVFDLYSGTGGLTLYLSKKAEKVIAIEAEKSAVTDAIQNAAMNGIRNIEFIHARAEEKVPYLEKGTPAGTFCLNPPRKGCSETLLRAVVATRPEKIVYISCNPSTLARDLQFLLKANFKIKSIQPVDMFPQTSHLESVTLLEQKA